MYILVRLRVNVVKRGKSVLKYPQIIQDYVEDGRKKTKIVKHFNIWMETWRRIECHEKNRSLLTCLLEIY
jgi:hypothetical protein